MERPVTIFDIIKHYPESVKRTAKTIEEIKKSIKEGYKKEGILPKVFATLDLMFSPFTYLGKTFGEYPTKKAFLEAGASPAQAKTAGELAKFAVEVATPFGLEKALLGVRKIPALLRGERLTEEIKAKRWKDFLAELEAKQEPIEKAPITQELKKFEQELRKKKLSPEEARKELQAFREKLLQERLPAETYQKYQQIKPVVETKLKGLEELSKKRSEIISEELRKVRSTIASIFRDRTRILTLDEAHKLLGLQKQAREIYLTTWKSFLEENPDLAKYLLTPEEIETIWEVTRYGGFDFTTQLNALDALHKLMIGEIPTKSRIESLKYVIGDELVERLLNASKVLKAIKETGTGKILRFASELVYFTRAQLASADFSALLRQGFPLIGTRAWWRNLSTYLRATFSEERYNEVVASIVSDPLFPLAQKFKLGLTEIGATERAEELFMSRIAEKLPWIKFSERGYVAFLNKLRFDYFKDMVKRAVELGYHPETHPEVFEAIAKYVNAATGRGNLPYEWSKVLSTIFFAPRLAYSRFEYLPRLLALPPELRVQEWKNLAIAFNAGLGALTAIKLLYGDEMTIETNPYSADFLKAKIGNVRIDPWGGFQQEVVLLARLANELMISSVTGKPYKLGDQYGIPTRGDIIVRYLTGKFHPVASAIANYLFERGYTETLGEKGIDEIIKNLMPFVIQDIWETFEENYRLVPLAVVASTLGMGVQVYGINDHVKNTIKRMRIPNDVVNTVNSEMEKLGVSLKRDFRIGIGGTQEGRIIFDKSEINRAYKAIYLKLAYGALYQLYNSKEYQTLPLTERLKATTRTLNKVSRTAKLYILGMDTKALNNYRRAIFGLAHATYLKLGYDDKTARMKADRLTEEVLKKMIEENRALLTWAQTINRAVYGEEGVDAWLRKLEKEAGKITE